MKTFREDLLRALSTLADNINYYSGIYKIEGIVNAYNDLHDVIESHFNKKQDLKSIIESIKEAKVLDDISDEQFEEMLAQLKK